MAKAPPVPFKRVQRRELFGEQLVDEYAWLREREDPRVREHLEAESSYALAHIDAVDTELRARLYAELRARIEARDQTVPSKDGPWLYYSRTEEDDEYPRHCRRRAVSEQPFDARPEQVYLDENELARGHEYFDLALLVLCPEHRRCAYFVDLEGDELYALYVLDLDTRELEGPIEGCAPALAWIDAHSFVYARLDASQRPWQAWRHELGRPTSSDQLLYQEDDGKFHLGLYRTRSGAYVAMSLDSQISSEVHLLPTAAAEQGFDVVEERREGIEYAISHGRAGLFMLSNRGGRNFALEFAPLDHGTRGEWRTLIAHREEVLLEDFDVFAEDLVVWERSEGLLRIRVAPLAPLPERIADASAPAPGEHMIAFDDPCYAVWGGGNCEFETSELHFSYTSLTTPTSTYAYDLRTRSRTLLKRARVLGGHEPAAYESRRVWAVARDGARVPISLVWRREAQTSVEPARPRPLVLYAYGAYGECSDPYFSSARKSLLDRGVVWAIAHVRGGGELGRAWYEAGKLGAKSNSFSDYIACAEHLIAEGWTTSAQLIGTGGSAGGLLIGAVTNARPELFTAMVADVPFVDVLNTMLDPELPLSLVERDEWGDPQTPEGFGWIRSYSPYDQVRAQDYPHMLVLAGWHDPRVGYWEPAKWVARLREHSTSASEILLWTNMEGGHAGASGRFEYLHEIALEYAFLIGRLGLSLDLPSRPADEPSSP